MAKIVIFDDSKMMLTQLKGLLEAQGHEVVAWQDVSAAEVAGRLSTDNPALVITDYQMPGCNGLTLTRMARTVNPDLPIIVLTASRDPAVVEPLLRLGARQVLHKPVQMAELLAVLAEVL